MPDEQKPSITVQLFKTKTTLRMVRFDVEGKSRDLMPNAYISQDALKAAFGTYPDEIKVTIEKIK